MLRSFLIYLSKAGWAQKLVTSWGIARWASSRFVAGETSQDAIKTVKELNEKGINATLDHLGEHTSTVEEANAAADAILTILNEIDESGVRASLSIKLTQIGVGLDVEICRQNLVRIIEHAKLKGNFVRIDMEDTPYTDITISLYESLVERGFNSETVGLVSQAYLYRSEKDMRDLLEKKVRLRIVKGAYNEPPEKAFPKKTDTDANYDLLAKIMIDAAIKEVDNSISENGKIPPRVVIASHDEKRIEFAKKHAEKIGLPKTAMEFQMLYGIRRELQEQLVVEGYPVRVYVPYGSQWYPYFMRRLAERPANIWFFISNFFRG